MKKVVNFEARRSRLWIGFFVAAIFLLTVIFVVFFAIAGAKIGERQTLDLLTLFGEDREIIAEFWQDTLLTFWEELPQKTLFITLLTLFFTAVFLWATRGKRRVIKRKLEELARYQKS